MYFKLLSILLAVLLVVESAFLYLHRPAPNRFRAVDGYGGLVAFDTATGQLCKTLKMKSAAEIEAESKHKVSATESQKDLLRLWSNALVAARDRAEPTGKSPGLTAVSVAAPDRS
jgi:hypothetical protein